MTAILVFFVRLILGLVFGILLVRIFKPEWSMFHGVITGIILTLLSYGMAYFRKKNS